MDDTLYDLVAYPSAAIARTHPRHVGAVATLFGMRPARQRWRVLELGCGDGANLIPIASAAPDGRFLGIDLSARAIARGQALIRQLGLSNIELRAMDLLDFPADAGEFDYVIAHGVYSWVPAAVREKLLAIPARHLAPRGIAFVSYNALPGGHLRRMARQMMLWWCGDEPDPAARVARARALIAALTAGDDAADRSPVAGLLREELKRYATIDDAVLFHDDLAPVNDAFHAHEFAAQAAGHGLAAFADADLTLLNEANFEPPVRALIDQCGEDALARDQIRDFVRARRFRQTLLCRAQSAPAPAPAPQLVRTLAVAADLAIEDPDDRPRSGPAQTAPGNGSDGLADAVERTFVIRGTTRIVRTNHAFTQAALLVLGERYPEALPFPALVEAARARLAGSGSAQAGEPAATALGAFLYSATLAGMVELTLLPSPARRHAGERPRTSRLARAQLNRGSRVTTAGHREVRLDDPIGRHLVSLLDGSRDRAALVSELAAFAARGAPPESTPAATLDLAHLEAFLGQLARLGLIEE